jgi:hypothetical protein
MQGKLEILEARLHAVHPELKYDVLLACLSIIDSPEAARFEVIGTAVIAR